MHSERSYGNITLIAKDIPHITNAKDAVRTNFLERENSGWFSFLACFLHFKKIKSSTGRKSGPDATTATACTDNQPTLKYETPLEQEKNVVRCTMKWESQDCNRRLWGKTHRAAIAVQTIPKRHEYIHQNISEIEIIIDLPLIKIHGEKKLAKDWTPKAREVFFY